LGKAQALPSAADAAHKTLVFKRFIEDWYYFGGILQIFELYFTIPKQNHA
jgi:hypothetical protein